MSKHSKGFKLEVVVHNYLSQRNGDGFRKTASKFGLDRTTVRQRVTVYQGFVAQRFKN